MDVGQSISRQVCIKCIIGLRQLCQDFHKFVVKPRSFILVLLY